MMDGVASDNVTAWPIWGHEHAIRELQAASIRGPRHAYILSGFDHLGKTRIATVFAQSLLCTDPVAPGVPCGVCNVCKRVVRGVHPDCSFWNLERQAQMAEKSTTSKNLSLNIQTVRDITSSLAMRPLESRYRVVVVDDVETMQESAQEAFLKTLEEPPSYAIILLLTSDAELLLETILSRAMTVHLQGIPSDQILKGLVARGIDSETAAQIAETSDGRPGWAIQASENATLLTERLEQLVSADRWIDADRYHQLVEATRLGDAFTKDRMAVYSNLLSVQRQWRSRLLDDIDTGADDIENHVQALKSVDICMRDLDANVRPKLALQTMVLQWPITNP